MARSEKVDDHNRCVLCDREVKKLIRGVRGGVCLDCVALCNDIIAQDKEYQQAQQDKLVSNPP